MHHAFIDKFSRGTTFVHRVDPRAKVLFFLPLVVLVNLTPIRLGSIFAGYAGLLLAIALAARVPLGYLAKRLALVLPFVLVIILFIPFLTRGEVAWRGQLWALEVSVTWEGLRGAANVLTKAMVCALALLLLVSTTRFDHLLRALEELWVPRVILLILSFLYRYLFILIEQAQQMKDGFERPVFIIEGNSDRDISINALKAAIATLTSKFGASIISTKNPKDTALTIFWLAKKEQQEEGRDVSVHVGKKSKDERRLQEQIVCGLPGVSTVTCRHLLEHFGTIEKVFGASEEELCEVKGVGKKMAKRIRSVLEKEWD